jgi:hypothetical protein
MTDDCNDNYKDDQDFQRKCEAAIWFMLVDGHIQHRCDHTDGDAIEAENSQAASLKSPLGSLPNNATK